jgi:hypothetical protein
MHRFVALCVVSAVTFCASACGRAEEPKPAAQAEPAATQPQQPQSLEKGAEQAAKGLEQMAQALAGGGSAPVEPVSFRDLQTVFPDLDGWEKGRPTGEKMSSPVSFSQATVRYTKGDSEIEAKIVDSGLNQLLLTPYAMFLAAGYEKDTGSGYEKSTTVSSYPGWERWNSDSRQGELNALVAKRFVVTLEGSGIDDTKILHEVASKTDLNRLASMK